MRSERESRPPIGATRNGKFRDNEIAFETGGEFNTAVSVGDDTEAETFQFARCLD